MNLTLTRLDLARLLRDPSTLIFIVLLPALLYIVFGGAAGYGDFPMGKGNVSMFVMINMATYGAVSATTSLAAGSAIEKMQGWGRQLALSGISDAQYVWSKIRLGLIIALMPVTVVYLIGFLMGASAPWESWAISYVVAVLGAGLISLYGLGMGMLIRSDVAVSITSGTIVLFGFIGNVFNPLTETLYNIAQFTPLYGLGVLARWASTEGQTMLSSGTIVEEDLTIAVANLAAWTIIFTALSIVALRRGRER
ncbi:MAG: ABC transporter permease [Actinomycetaceae bacterium]|nr:ABC transporter permease [Actinomycetaceae bacterium]